MLNSVGTDVTRLYSFKYSPKVRTDNDSLICKIDTGFQTSKIDSEFQVDKTSDEYKSIMKLYDDICKDYMNTLSEHNKTLHNKLLTDPSKDLYEKVRSSAYESQSRIYKKSAVEAVDADDEVSEEKLQGIGLTSFGISDAESRVVLASYVKDSGEDDPVVQIAYGQGDDRKVYHIHVNDVDISNASDMEMFALLSYEGYKGRTAPGAINNYSAYKTLKAGGGYEMGSADENCFVDEKINVKHLMQKIYDSLKDHKTAEEEKSFEECDYLRWLITNRKKL